jgi:hypothetical protein
VVREGSRALAIYHCTSKPLGRRSGRTAVAASAYRRGVRLVDQHGRVHDYRGRRGVAACFVVAPARLAASVVAADGPAGDGTAAWWLDPQALWLGITVT